ncbi:hypothetical protein GCM10010294_09600 [Streptomyces griseoloalbus]|nr:hypothetical protein GCM10010294_09600 [Streptomyces griseoloalbus]
MIPEIADPAGRRYHERLHRLALLAARAPDHMRPAVDQLGAVDRLQRLRDDLR